MSVFVLIRKVNVFSSTLDKKLLCGKVFDAKQKKSVYEETCFVPVIVVYRQCCHSSDHPPERPVGREAVLC
jgi:hypothetical protein